MPSHPYYFWCTETPSQFFKFLRQWMEKAGVKDIVHDPHAKAFKGTHRNRLVIYLYDADVFHLESHPSALKEVSEATDLYLKGFCIEDEKEKEMKIFQNLLKGIKHLHLPLDGSYLPASFVGALSKKIKPNQD